MKTLDYPDVQKNSPPSATSNWRSRAQRIGSSIEYWLKRHLERLLCLAAMLISISVIWSYDRAIGLAFTLLIAGLLLSEYVLSLIPPRDETDGE